MKKIMFNDRYGLTEAVLSGRKTQTRRIAYDFRKHASNKVGKCVLLGNNNLTYKDGEVQVLDELRSPQYQVGEVVAVAQAYKDFGAYCIDSRTMTNKMFVKAEYMPHHIRITNVRVERLQGISDQDCFREGIRDYSTPNEKRFGFSDFKRETIVAFKTPRKAYAALIDKISGKGTWDSNPYVFVYDFELVK